MNRYYSVNNGISTTTIKLIALTTMLIDHLTVYIYAPMMIRLKAGLLFDVSNDLIYMLGRGIGRLSYPLFCFLIAQGAKYSANRLKYAFRIGIFAIISTPCYNLAKYNRLLNGEELNIMFGLMIGLVTIMLIDYVRELDRRNLFKIILGLIIIIAMSAIAIILHIEYSACSVLLISAFYYAERLTIYERVIPDLASRRVNLGSIALVLGLYIYYFFWTLGNSGEAITFSSASHNAIMLFGKDICVLAAFIPIWYFNDGQGKKLPRYFSYVIYPLHLAVLGIVECLIKGILIFNL